MNNAPDIRLIKRAAREAAEAVRTAAKQAAPDAGARMRDHFIQAVPLPPATTVSSYAPRGSELDPQPLEHALTARGHALCLPVVIGRGHPLAFRAYRHGDRLVPGHYDIPEPLPETDVVTPRAILVPLLAFDRGGNRLGYGGGYYDRSVTLLRRESGMLAIGVAYAAQEVDAVPVGRTDAKLDWIVTEKEAISCY
ncbi:MAG: 5-formyltetrahydrofolate cyclo-ligase [Alphaproteobacteria bacterium]|nr:5-formyltetrahydrofolate cyclo-ligase [Alphaproteobacteria bacterium]